MSLVFYFVSCGLILDMSESDEKKNSKRVTDFLTDFFWLLTKRGFGDILVF